MLAVQVLAVPIRVLLAVLVMTFRRLSPVAHSISVRVAVRPTERVARVLAVMLQHRQLLTQRQAAAVLQAQMLATVAAESFT